MKKVLSISVNGKFKQYLMRSESKYIPQMCKAWGAITVELVEITEAHYKTHFGK